MQGHNLKNWLMVMVLWSLGTFSLAQNTDCRTALLICSDTAFQFLPMGRGIDDFENPNNDEGCIFLRENISAWFYFELREDMPLDSGTLLFNIIDDLNDVQQDYDFAIYGADLNCDSLGTPLRCSFGRVPINGQNQRDIIFTGLSYAATDTSEGFLGDGFVAPLNVKPGQGFFLLIDFFVRVVGQNFDSTAVQDFTITWDGPAAPYLNCTANPNCDQVVVDAGRDTTVCAGVTLDLSVSALNTNRGESYSWEILNRDNAFLSDTLSPNTQLRIPDDFSGALTVRSTVTEGACVHFDDLVVTVIGTPAPAIAGDTLICDGDTTILDAGPGFLTYQWENGPSTQTFAVSDPGLYRVTVTGANGCPGVAELQVNEPPVPAPFITGRLNICPGESTLLSGPSGYSSYQWSNNSGFQAIRISSPGVYTLTVTDDVGCEVSRSAQVRILDPPVPEITAPPVLCAGDTVTLIGEPGYRAYQWFDGSTGTSVAVSRADSFRLSVIDTNGCLGSNTIFLEERENPQPAVFGDAFFCANAATTIAAPDGFDAYFWSTGDTLPSVVLDQPGAYNLRVRDSLGCEGSTNFMVDTLAVPIPRFSGQDYFCAGESLTLSLSAPYTTYRWSTGDSLAAIVTDSAALYAVTVTDANGCVGEGQLSVREAPLPQPVITGDTILCPGERTSLSAGAGFARYQWSSAPQDTTASITTDFAGVVFVSVVDSLGCTGSDMIVLRDVPAPSATIEGSESACEGETVALSAVGAYPSYRWSTGDSTRAINVAQTGRYGLWVEDANGCRDSTELNFRVFPIPEPEISGNLRLCRGNSTTLRVQNTFTGYLWSTGATGPEIQLRDPGVYEVTVTGSGGCFNADTVAVQVFDPIPSPLDGGRLDICQGDSLTLDGGPGFVDYQWSTGQRGRTITVTQGGTFSLTVLDTNTCISTSEVEVTLRTIAEPDIFGQPEFCSGQTVTLLVNRFYRSYEWSNGDSLRAIEISEGGDYTVTVTNNFGCTAVASRTITEQPAPDIEIEGDIKICNGDTTVLSVASGYQSYLWTTDAITESITVTEPGYYGVIVFNFNGCTSSDQVLVQKRPRPLPVITGRKEICSNELAELGTQDAYQTYFWSTGDTTATIQVNRTGLFGVTITDDFGCEGRAQTNIISKPAPVIAFDGPAVLCEGETARFSVDSTLAAYRWSNGDTTYFTRLDTGGWYYLTVTAPNDCVETDSFELEVLPGPGLSLTGVPYFCEGGATSFRVNGSNIEDIRWFDGQDTSFRQFDAPGTYELVVSSPEGCETVRMLEIEEIVVPGPDAGPDTTLNCYFPQIRLGAADSATVGYLPVWNGPGIQSANRNTFSPAVTRGGTYTLQWLDTLSGCRSPFDTVLVADRRYAPVLDLRGPPALTCTAPTATLEAVLAGGTEHFTFRLEGPEVAGTPGPVWEVGLAGAYRLEALDTLTGCAAADVWNLAWDTLAPIARIIEGGPLNCRADSVELSANRPPEGAVWDYRWTLAGTFLSGGAQRRIRTGLPGWHRILITDRQNGCSVADSFLVADDRQFPDYDAGPDKELDCVFTSADLGRSDYDPAWTFTWTKNNDPTFRSAEGLLTVSRPGTYIVRVNNPLNGCNIRDTVTVSQYDNAPTALAAQVRNESCFGRSDGSIQIESVSGGDGPFLYSLDGRVYGTATRFDRLPPGRYNVRVQDARGCELETRVAVLQGTDLKLEVGPNQTIRQGDSVRIRALTNIDEAAIRNFSWIRPADLPCDTCRSFNSRPLTTTVYSAVLTDTNGCSTTDLMQVFVNVEKAVYVPTAFSPNGDGINDRVTVFASPNVALIRNMRIYDRFGEMVYFNQNFRPNDESIGWDGFHRGILMNAQVFVWQLEAEFLDGTVQILTGDVTLVR